MLERRSAVLFAVVLLAVSVEATPAPRDWLAMAVTPAVLAKLLPAEQWHPYPRIDEREAWSVIPEDTRNAIVVEAERSLGQNWEPLPATLFLEVARDGNRLR